MPPAEGWLYPANMIDLFSRKILESVMSKCMTTDLVRQALQIALRSCQPADGLLHHSDRAGIRWVQYASRDYQTRLAANGIVIRTSWRGNCYDKATIESFWITLKTKTLDTNQPWSTHQQVQTAIFAYM
jgi:putative transposase